VKFELWPVLKAMPEFSKTSPWKNWPRDKKGGVNLGHEVNGANDDGQAVASLDQADNDTESKRLDDSYPEAEVAGHNESGKRKRFSKSTKSRKISKKPEEMSDPKKQGSLRI
jgi:hypothetical protein